MEGISSLAAVVQILGNAATAAIKIAQFIRDVKNSPKAHDDLQSRLGAIRRTLDHLARAIRERKAQLGNVRNENDFGQEEKDVLQQALDIEADCKRSVERLEDFSKYQNGTLKQRLKGQLVQSVKQPEIQRLESRIQTNVGAMQLLLLFLKTFVHDNPSDRENLLLDIRQQTRELKSLQDSFASTLREFVSHSEHIEDIENAPIQFGRPLSMITEEDGRDLMRTTNRTLKTADSLVDKLSRAGSETIQTPLDSESLFSDGRIPIMLQVEATASNNTIQWTSTPTSHLALELMTDFLDKYIEQAKEDLAHEDLDECEKNLKSAIKWGEDRFHQHGQAFEQWFELQLLLAEVYQNQGKSADAQKLILELMQSSTEKEPEYSRVTPVQKAHLYYARANFCLDGYNKSHNITLSDLENIAQEAYSFVEKLKTQNEVESYPGDSLSNLLTRCARTWSQVTEMQGDKAKTRAIRERHPDSSDHPSRPHPSHAQSGVGASGRRRHSSFATSERQGTHSTSPTGWTSTPEASSDTAPTAASSENNEHGLTLKLASIGDVEKVHTAGLTPLLVAAKQGEWEMMRGLIERLSANVNAKDRDGRTALHHSLRRVTCDEATIKLLLSRDIDVNAVDPNGDTALHYSVHFQHRKAASILLKSGKVDVEARNEKGQTAAALAVTRGETMDPSILKLLLSHGAYLDIATLPRQIRPVVERLKAGLARRESQSSSSTVSTLFDRVTRRSGPFSVM